MACPFFMPVDRVLETGWIHAPRLPLGARYRGKCLVRADDPFEADGDLCNCGYARGACDRFPSDAEADAHRFSVLAGDPPRMIYVIERGHAPAEHRIFEDPSSLENRILAAQARAFADSFTVGPVPDRPL